MIAIFQIKQLVWIKSNSMYETVNQTICLINYMFNRSENNGRNKIAVKMSHWTFVSSTGTRT